MVRALAARLAEKGIEWDPERNHIACLTHVINLAVKEFLKTLKIQARTPEDEWEVLEFHARQASSTDPWQKYKIKGNNPFDRAIQKIRKISSLINYPPSHLSDFRKMCELQQCKFLRAVRDVDTRWNSTHAMLARALLLREAINGWTRMKSDYVNLILSNEEWRYVEFLVHFLTPFYRTTIMLQATGIPTLQQTFETYESLFNALDNVRGLFQEMIPRPDWLTDVEVGIGQMWDKLRFYYSKDKPLAYVDAILLHPAEKNRWFRRREWNTDLVESYRKSLKDRLHQDHGDVLRNLRKRDYTAMLSEESDSGSDSDSDPNRSEFDIYMGYKRQRVENPLEFWKQYQGIFPNLSRLARDTYAVPATGAGVEREFSISGNLVDNRRNRLKPKTIADLMQYKRWVTRTGALAKFLKDNEAERLTEMAKEDDGDNEDQEEELNQDLIDWLEKLEKENQVEGRIKGLRVIAQRVM